MPPGLLCWAGAGGEVLWSWRTVPFPWRIALSRIRHLGLSESSQAALSESGHARRSHVARAPPSGAGGANASPWAVSSLPPAGCIRLYQSTAALACWHVAALCCCDGTVQSTWGCYGPGSWGTLRRNLPGTPQVHPHLLSLNRQLPEGRVRVTRPCPACSKIPPSTVSHFRMERGTSLEIGRASCRERV